jgi:hypothetical protein
MSERLLGFLNSEPRATETKPQSEWRRAPAPSRQSGMPIRSADAKATPTNTNQPFLKTAVDANAREWFKALAEEWHRETAAHSSMTIRQRHSAYRKMVNLGPVIVPMLLQALQEMPDFWFPLLREITKENPVKPDERGDYKKMSDAWLAWGRGRGLII